MTTRDLIIRSRAATYLNTSIVAMTDDEYHNYLKQVIDFNYPNLLYWYTLYQRGLDAGYQPNTPEMAAWLAIEVTEYLKEHDILLDIESSQRYLAQLPDWLYKIYTFYKYLTFMDTTAQPITDPYEWWLCTPTGPESCSRDLGDLRYTLNIGKGDEWDTDLEIAITLFQLEQQPYIPLPTGYACAETQRRLRLTL